MKFLAPTCVFVMLCIFACGGVEKAGDLASMDGSPSGVASTGADPAVKVSGRKSEIQPTGFGPAQNVEETGALTSMDGSPSGVASTGADQAVIVSGGKSEIQPTGFGPAAQNVDKELNAYVDICRYCENARMTCCYDGCCNYAARLKKDSGAVTMAVANTSED